MAIFAPDERLPSSATLPLPISGQWGIREEGLKNLRLPELNDIKSLYGVWLFQKKVCAQNFAETAHELKELSANLGE